ncbi:MAG: cysteine desulfurase [Clostridia bacterium]|nr:cysteine desulfurase [Clostridia bacterium]
MKPMIYLDNGATTRVCEEALEVYLEVSRSHYGNPSSLHAVGFDAEGVLKSARADILRTLGAKDGTLIFTASGSEANNLAIFGRAHAKDRYRGKRILTTDGEHSSVSAVMEALKKEGYRTETIPTVGGALDFEALDKMLGADVILISAMIVNNETGALYDIARLSAMMRAKCPDCALHVDATQGYMKVPFTPQSLGADMVTVSSHKIEGPKGVGALYITQDTVKTRGLSPLILGGGQEGGYRSGTENVPGIAAFAKAAVIAKNDLQNRINHVSDLRAYLLKKLAEDERLSDIKPLCPARFAPHILSLRAENIKSETMLHFLSAEGICVSSGSACSSNAAVRHASPALLAYGQTEAEADSSIRVSFSHRNTYADVDALCEALALALTRLARIRRQR